MFLFIFTYDLFYDAVSFSNHITSWSNLRYYPGICLEGLRKTANNLSQGNWFTQPLRCVLKMGIALNRFKIDWSGSVLKFRLSISVSLSIYKSSN
jgi:hypothetical protein